jgi:hypothetical protein
MILPAPERWQAWHGNGATTEAGTSWKQALPDSANNDLAHKNPAQNATRKSPSKGRYVTASRYPHI